MMLELPGNPKINLTDHDTVISWAIRAPEMVPLREVVRTFIVGAASGRLDLLSCLGSWSNLRHVRPHSFERWNDPWAAEPSLDLGFGMSIELPDLTASLGCKRCGFGDIISHSLDLQGLEVERMAGDFRSDTVIYWMYDTFRILQDGVPRMRASDADHLRRLLEDLDACSRRRGSLFKRTDAINEIRAGHQQAGLTLTRKAAARLLDSLGSAGVLCPRSLPCPFDEHVPLEVKMRTNPGHGTFGYPFHKWSGADGVDFERLEELLESANIAGQR